MSEKLTSNVSGDAVFERRWLALLNALPDLLFELDEEGRYLDYHSPRTELLAVPEAQFLGKTLHEVMSPATAEIGMMAIQEALATGVSRGHQIELTLASGKRWFELSVSRKDGLPGAAPTFVFLSRDVTERKLAEFKLQRLTKLYAALSQCNQAIVRCHDETELFDIICRDAVNFGGMKMAWIGVPDASGKHLQPVASFGDGQHYLAGVGISLDANDCASHGPVGKAVREDRPCWCQDFQHDATTKIWHERAKTHGWGAVAALPLHRRGRVVGMLAAYAEQAHAFDDAAQALLVEMVMDISYALDRFSDELERQQVQTRLRESEERYRLAFHISPDAVNINRLSDGLYLDANEGFARLTGWQRTDVIGKTSADIHIWRHLADREKMVLALRTEGRCTNLEADFVKKDGSLCRGLMSAVVVCFNDVDCILSITRDISEMAQARAQIEWLAHFDQLTGLPNRAQLQQRFNLALELARRSGEGLAVMFLDLDHFKNINDALGHKIGDQLLVLLAKRMATVLRSVDMLSRQGGDEFILLLTTANAEAAAQVAQKLIAQVVQPCDIENHELVNTLSIGIALYPQDGQDFETLSKNADIAMYRVKQASRNGYCFFAQEMQIQSQRSLQLVNAMHHALERGEFQLLYQPQVSMQNGQLVGAEALLRWQHPQLGDILPTEFIPIAEDSGQILAIGEWVLQSAVMQAKRWQTEGLPPMVMAVNLSAVQFRHPDLFKLVTSILDLAELPAQYLELELTEATTMERPLAAIELMNRLHGHGIQMAIDDFGTGYSSLSYLKKFKITKLKIDQSFVRDISDDPDDKAIVSAIINLASSLGLRTIAEGVESASQLAFLRLQGCDEVQGYYFSRPLTAAQFEVFARQSVLPA